MHEMRYLDTVLSPTQSKVPDDKNSSSLARGDSLMSSLDHLAAQITTLPNGCTIDDPSRKQNSTPEPRRYHQKIIATSRRYSRSSLSHQYDSETENDLKKPEAAHDKTYSNFPIPSMTKRRQFHRRFMQQARIKSHKLARKMIEFASYWTRNESNLMHMIRKSVKISVRKVQIVLEQSRRGDASSVKSRNVKRSPVAAEIGMESGNTLTILPTAYFGPPLKAFSFAPKWAGTQSANDRKHCSIGHP
ncbi:hypothetical protein ACHAWX_003280 [Stephanocyclus meneghinianus]